MLGSAIAGLGVGWFLGVLSALLAAIGGYAWFMRRLMR